MIGTLHDRLVFKRRTQVLADHVAGLIPVGARVLDVGCGDGTIDVLIQMQRTDVLIEGLDPLVRPAARIPVRSFNGESLPFPDQTFDVVMFVDVLHHTDDPKILLKEAARVGKFVLMKDHFRDGLFADTTLRLMDWAGNARHGVVSPYNYWPKAEWVAAFGQAGLRVVELREHLNLYPAPLSWFFERHLHFIAWCESVARKLPAS